MHSNRDDNHRFLHFFRDVLTAGHPDSADFVGLRKIVLINLSIVIGVFFLTILGVLAFAQSNAMLGFGDFGLALFVAGLYIYLRKTQNVEAASLLGLVVAGLFFLFLTVIGGVNQSAVLWSLVYPTASLFLMGIRRGSILTFAFLIVLAAVFLMAPTIAFFTEYPRDFIVRFVAVYIVLFAMGLIMERVREAVQTQLQNSNRQLLAANETKDVLFKELHHRVKNNFAIVSSLLNLQARQVDDPETKAILLQSKSRIQSMALVHEQLHQSDSFAHVAIKPYICKLASELLVTYKSKDLKLESSLDIEDIQMPMDKVIPCGLIVSELLSNAFKHAFPPAFTGARRLKVQFHQQDSNQIQLIVADNGVGIASPAEVVRHGSLGLELVRILAEDQLHGRFTLSGDNGTSVEVLFKV